jgi:hypothetical protein
MAVVEPFRGFDINRETSARIHDGLRPPWPLLTRFRRPVKRLLFSSAHVRLNDHPFR